MTDSQKTDFPAFTEHRVQRDRGSLYVRDFPGSGPAFVLLHGFPDNSHIYDDLIPHLAATISRRIEGCFGSTAPCIVSTVMLHSLTWLSALNLLVLLIGSP